MPSLSGALGMGTGKIGSAESEPELKRIVARVSEMGMQMEELRGRIGRAADRLVGAVPCELVDSAGKEVGLSGGLIRDMDDCLHAFRAALSDANDQMTRLERVF